MASTEVWPGLTEGVAQVFTAVGQGMIPINLDQYVVRRATFFHRQTYGTGGFTSQTYFSTVQGPQKFVTNWPSGQGLQAQYGFWMTGLRFKAETGITLAGARAAGGLEASGAATATAVSFANAEEIRTIMQSGQVTVTAGQRLVIEGWGLDSYPQGGGLMFYPAASGTFTATNMVNIAAKTNGSPDANNLFTVPWTPILPNKSLACTVEFPAALSVTTAFVLTAITEGILVYPANI